MELIVACNDQALATSVRDSLARAGIECAASRVLTVDSTEAAIRDSSGRLAIVVLFCSRRLLRGRPDGNQGTVGHRMRSCTAWLPWGQSPIQI